MGMDAVSTECPRCRTAFDGVSEVDRHGMPGVGTGDSLYGGSVTCDRCGAEFEVYYYP
ncbi:hypothetical protein [Halorarum salinum]|nr:hypothetical protein [Halobaculum salinum]